jgi:DNA helicase-2/ATP-dependent DNA helicase PcrA
MSVATIAFRQWLQWFLRDEHANFPSLMSQLVPPGSDAARIVEEEERLLARVLSRAALPIEDDGERAVAADFDRELIQMRDAIAEAKPEDLAPLVEQMTRLAAIRGRLGGSRVLPIDAGSPYFAHMALADDAAGTKRRRDILIGKRGFIDRKAGVQIVDWRNAPISQIYYRYEEGDDYDEHQGEHELRGVVVLRRNLSISRSILRRVGAPQGTFVRTAAGQWKAASEGHAPTLGGGQGSASRPPAPRPVVAHARGASGRRDARRFGVHDEASARADKHLPEIAALIDREQFDLISQPTSGLVVIQGGAGSGKTTVALHRIAYLVFSDPQRFRPNKLLFVVPAEALVRYVAGVLPSLGVDKVPVVTYAAWARATRKKVVPDAPAQTTDGAPEVVARLKKHPRMLEAMEAYVADQEREADDELRRVVAGQDGGEHVLAAWDQLRGKALVPRLRRLYKAVKDGALPAATRIKVEALLVALGRRADDVVEDWGELVTDRPRLERHLVATGAAKASELDRLIAWCAAQQDAPAEVPVDDDGVEFASVDGRALDEGHTGGKLDDEDDPLLLRLVQLKRGGLAARGVDAIEYEHVAIDEAQDRSAIEVKVLLEATRAVREPDGRERRSVTIAGDTAQRLVFDNAFAGWDDLLRATGQSGAMVRPLSLSYRSTAEVMQLARDVLGPDLAPAEPLRARSGAPVELHEFGDIGEAVGFIGEALRGLMGREPTASVAVITRFAEQADQYADGLRRAEVPSLRRVKRQDFPFVPGVDVTDVSQVKGLEFDYVLMVDLNASVYPDSVEARHLLHIGMTRAAHQLWLIATDEPSPLLPASLRGA